MSPFQLRRERFSEFLLLSKRLSKMSGKESKSSNNTNKPQKKYIKVLDYKKPNK